MTATPQETQQRIEQSQGLVHSIATAIAQIVPSHFDQEDLVAYGQLGLAEAARDFDPARGCAFSTYAYYRIRGAIYDGLSKLSWVSRARYNRLRYEQRANEVLAEQATGGAWEDRADSSGSDAAWLGNTVGKLAVVYLATQDDESRGSADQIADSEPRPAEVVALRELCGKVRELIDTLPSQAAKLIKAAYFEGLTLQQAGERIGVSRSRASRLHAEALERLGRALRRIGAA